MKVSPSASCASSPPRKASPSLDGFTARKSRKRISLNGRNWRTPKTKSSPDRRLPETARPSHPEMGNDDAAMAREPSPRLAHAAFPDGRGDLDQRGRGQGRASGMAHADRARATARDTLALRLPAV